MKLFQKWRSTVKWFLGTLLLLTVATLMVLVLLAGQPSLLLAAVLVSLVGGITVGWWLRGKRSDDGRARKRPGNSSAVSATRTGKLVWRLEVYPGWRRCFGLRSTAGRLTVLMAWTAAERNGWEQHRGEKSIKLSAADVERLQNGRADTEILQLLTKALCADGHDASADGTPPAEGRLTSTTDDPRRLPAGGQNVVSEETIHPERALEHRNEESDERT